MLYILFFIIGVIHVSASNGIIMTKDIILNFCSVGYLSKMTLPFSLTNPLNNNEFIFLSSNNIFHKSFSRASSSYADFDVPFGLKAVWGVKSECDDGKIYSGTNKILYQKVFFKILIKFC
jgi:hypothetical protein